MQADCTTARRCQAGCGYSVQLKVHVDSKEELDIQAYMHFNLMDKIYIRKSKLRGLLHFQLVAPGIYMLCLVSKAKQTPAVDFSWIRQTSVCL